MHAFMGLPWLGATMRAGFIRKDQDAQFNKNTLYTDQQAHHWHTVVLRVCAYHTVSRYTKGSSRATHLALDCCPSCIFRVALAAIATPSASPNVLSVEKPFLDDDEGETARPR